MEGDYTIGDLVKKLNINKETIRYYEKIGLLSEPKKNANGYRIYSEKDIEMIRFICIIKNFGFSLREISILIHDEILCGNIEDIKRIVEGKINELSVKINKLEETKKLLEKVKRSLLSKDMEGCKDMEIYLKK
ncbi:MerR family transcriptional regulator [Clostridium felsineum]|uniref:MerR family transcriptional regulator n=1 Tax=Clostridium felsineum TaxID=36839 RepID=UPI00098C0B9A|nr:MerR family transcriptional regulator [Clostridium felsineum]URZ14382.1 Mercuric resistance operon regulatory protein [Clostridium felsineum DSM 794]